MYNNWTSFIRIKASSVLYWDIYGHERLKYLLNIVGRSGGRFSRIILSVTRIHKSFFRMRGSSRWRCLKPRTRENACSTASPRCRKPVQTNCPATAAGCVDFVALFVRLSRLCTTISAVVIFLAQWARKQHWKSTAAITVQPSLKLTDCSLITRTSALRTHSFSSKRKTTLVVRLNSNIWCRCIV